jgi:redox-sensitive bicupin YhaK (pirin superfamily)
MPDPPHRPSRAAGTGKEPPLVHEAVVPITPERVSLDTRHPHRGFDNLWYAISGASSTSHSTGPGGATERARLEAGSLLKLRTGRGVWHAEGIGQDELAEGQAGTQMRGLLFWVNLARRDKDVEPSAQLLGADEMPVRHDGDATARVLIGPGSPVSLGTPGLILDIELAHGGSFTSPAPRSSTAWSTCRTARPASAPADTGSAGPRSPSPGPAGRSSSRTRSRRHG